MALAGETGVRLVAAVEGDAPPVHKTTRGRPGGAQRVVVVNNPGQALAHAARAGIESHGDSQ